MIDLNIDYDDYNKEIYEEDPLKDYRHIINLSRDSLNITKYLTYLQYLMIFLFFIKGAFLLSALIGIVNIGVSFILKDLAVIYVEDNRDNIKPKDKIEGKIVSDILIQRGIKAIKLMIFGIINSLGYKIGYKAALMLAKNNPESVSLKPIVILLIVLNILTAAIILFIMKKRETEESIEILEESNILEEHFGIFIPEIKEHVNDVKLVVDPDSGQDVFWREDDRFVHMLILGPTGSGKTSQIIIPLLNQDIQVLESGITVIEPKGDLAEKVYAMAQHYGRDAYYFNPILEYCPSYNPLYGKEEDVIETMVTTFKMLNPDSPQFFQDINEQLIRNALTVLKRLRGNKATMLELETIVSNPSNRGRNIVLEFIQLHAPNPITAKQNQDIGAFFLKDYYEENSKLYENTSGFRAQINKIVSNKFLRKVLNPENGKSDINFDHHLISNGIIAISTAQGQLRDLGSFLGYFLILSLQASVFKRPKAHRPNHFLYIDEFQVYSNPGFADMLTQGRSYNVASHLATQNRALIGMGSGSTGKDFIELVSTNARNVVIFPGGNAQDANYYEKEIGEVVSRSEKYSISRQKAELLKGGGSRPTNESISFSKNKDAKFSSNDLIYQEFRTVFYKIVKDKSVQPYEMGEIEFIPYELNKSLDKMIEENEALLMNGIDPTLIRDKNNKGAIDDYYKEPIKQLVEYYNDLEKYQLLDDKENWEDILNKIDKLNDKYFTDLIVKSQLQLGIKKDQIKRNTSFEKDKIEDTTFDKDYKTVKEPEIDDDYIVSDDKDTTINITDAIDITGLQTY